MGSRESMMCIHIFGCASLSWLDLELFSGWHRQAVWLSAGCGLIPWIDSGQTKRHIVSASNHRLDFLNF